MPKYIKVGQLFDINPMLNEVEIYDFIEEIEDSKNLNELLTILKKAINEYYLDIYNEAYDILETHNKGKNIWDKAYSQVLSLEKELEELF